MGDDQPPRYGLRSSPMKAPSATVSSVLISAERPGCPTGLVGNWKDESVDRHPSSSAFRKLTFATFKASSINLPGTSISSSNIGDRSLRANATFYSSSTASFIPRVRSSTCLPVAPFVEERQKAASTPSNRLFAPPVPPRRAHSNPGTSIDVLPSAKGGGLTRSVATTRLLPASKVIQGERHRALQSSDISIDHTDNVEEKHNNSVVPHRAIISSASVACLRQEALEVASHATARARPPSPVRIAKSNSGLLRSYSSVVIGVTNPTSIIQESKTTVSKTDTNYLSNQTTSRTQKKEKIEEGIPHQDIRFNRKISISSLRKRSLSANMRNGHPRRSKEVPLSDTSVSLPKLARSSSSSHFPTDIQEGNLSSPKKNPTAPDQRAPKESRPPQSPINRSLKRRLQAGADSDHTDESPNPAMKIGISTLSTTSPINAMPSASFFLRDDFVIPNVSARLMSDEKGTGSGQDKQTPETTPKPTRRSKKMRRLEMESGEVDEEARSLELDSSGTSPICRPQPHHSRCTVMQTSRVDYCTSYTRAAKDEDIQINEGSIEAGTSCHSAITPVKLPPAPEKSAMRREKGCSSRNVRFAHVDVFLFERTQGFLAVPSTGEVCLGMEDRHHDKERVHFDGGADDADIAGMDEIRPQVCVRLPTNSSPRRLPPGEKYTTKHIEPLSSKQRSRMLRTSGVRIPRDAMLRKPEHESIRQRRLECGCSCVGGRCLPESCECSREGIPCQVDNEDDTTPFPCRCQADTCQNAQGRVEFNSRHVHEHYMRTFARLQLGERMGNDALASPSLIRFTDDDEAPQHNATSYLATPPPAIYQTPTAPSSRALAAPPEIGTMTPLQATQPCTPPMQQLKSISAGMAISAVDGDQQHCRFPVTPVYKKYSGGCGETSRREVPLSRMAILKASTSISAPSEFPNTAANGNATVTGDVLDDSMDSSMYATPPESNSPAI